MSEKAEKLGELLQLMGGSALKGASLPDLCEVIAKSKNEQYAAAFARVPFAERIVLLPQCLRRTGACRAEERKAEYVCARCGACKIAEIIQRAEDLGYMAVKILKGGAAVGRLLEELKPRGALGVACAFEGAIGMLECERRDVAVQFVPLLKDGCADTDVDLEAVLQAMAVLDAEAARGGNMPGS